MQHEFGYPALTHATKERILSHNAQQLYGVTATAMENRAWTANAAETLRASIASGGFKRSTQ
jgi:hypothetical protein